MIRKVEAFMERYHMTAPGETILVGLSGGADSVLLTELLYELAPHKGFSVLAVHVNHNLRGEEAERDAAFARQFCMTRGIPFFLYSCQVEQRALEEGTGTEEAGRAERQRVFGECMQKYGADKVALAHHRNDVAETMLHHLARGTSLTGLASLRPVRENIIRPLLCLERGEIEQELKRRGLSWCEDATNALDDYTRNVLRHHVLPVLERQVNQKAVAHMAQTSLDLLEAEEYFGEKTEILLGKYGREVKGGFAISEDIRKEPGLLKRYAVRACVQKVSGQRKDLGREHLAAVLELLEKQVGRKISLPGRVTAVRQYDGILFRKEWEEKARGQTLESGGDRSERQDGTSDPREEIRVAAEGEYQIGNARVKAAIFENPGMEDGCGQTAGDGDSKRISENKYTKCFNYDKIKNGLVLRTRRSGDYLTIRSDGARKKLKDYMIDIKIPKEKRDHILLAADGDEIVWVAGYRVSEKYRVREGTGKIIQLEISGGYTNE